MNTHETDLDIEALRSALRDWFAPWVQALGLQVHACGPGEVTLRLPLDPALTRIGQMVCGQALMAAADTAMVLAIVTQVGRQQPMTTVQQSSSFLRPLSGQDAWVKAQVLRAGKRMVFGEIDISGCDDGKSVCRVSTTYALL